MILLISLILYLLIGIALAELLKKEYVLYSCVEYITVILLYPVIVIAVLCLILRDWWEDKYAK